MDPANIMILIFVLGLVIVLFVGFCVLCCKLAATVYDCWVSTGTKRQLKVNRKSYLRKSRAFERKEIRETQKMPFGFTKSYVDSKQKDFECAICLEPRKCNGSDKIRTLICMHAFHNTCISKWLTINKSCPVCRTLSLAVSEIV